MGAPHAHRIMGTGPAATVGSADRARQSLTIALLS